MKQVVVIGAGIMGASTAYRLSKLGAKVVVVDRQDPGQGTAAAAGIICPWLTQRRNKAWYRLAKAGARYYPRLIEELQADGEANTGYKQVGAICIQQDRSKLEAMMERAMQRKAEAPEMGEVSMLDEQETMAKFPLLSEGYAALHVTGAARVDGRALRDAMLRAAQQHGAKLIYGNARLIHEQNKVLSVAVGEQRLSADEVIVCAGAWANELLHPLGIMLDFRYQKGQIMHFHTESDENTGTWPVVMPPTNQYMLAFADRRIVIGATHEDAVNGYDTSVTAGGMHEILSKGMQVAAGLANCRLQEIRVGFRPHTPGFLPVMGRADGWEGIIIANGLGSSGLTVGPFLGDQLAKLALDLELDIEPNDYALEQAMLKESGKER